METSATLRQFGSSIGLAIPSQVRAQLGLSFGQPVNIKVVDSGFLVQPVSTPTRYTLAELVAQCDAKAPVSAEITAWRTMKAVGRERAGD